MIEKVNPKHPDKIADRIAGAIVDLGYKLQDNPKIAVEVLIGHGVCHVIVETSVDFNKEDIENIITRIAGDMSKDIVLVPQDIHLSKNQEEEIRCGDNGIFKGMPVTEEQRKLAKKKGGIINMLVSIIIILCFIVIIAGLFYINIITKKGKEINVALTGIFIMFASLILGATLEQSYYEDKILNVERFCEENSISYIFVQTVAEMTNTPEMDVATISYYAMKNELELPEVLYIIDPTIPEDDIGMIIRMSDRRQKLQEEQLEEE